MKSCPKCNRTFPDEGQKFCTFDGGLLIAPQTFDPNATIRATSIDLNAASERPTSRDLPDPNATIIENYPATVALPRNTGPTTGPTGHSEYCRHRKATGGATANAAATTTAATSAATCRRAADSTLRPKCRLFRPAAAHAPAPSAPLPPPVAQKKSKMPWIIAGVLVFLLLGGGVLAGAFFFFVKPRLDEMAAERNPSRPAENTNVSTPTASQFRRSAIADAGRHFVPPPADTVQFENSNANLDGKLAEHYFDFSFYYPESWARDPKAGVAGRD